jgi:hypothetical protein
VVYNGDYNGGFTIEDGSASNKVGLPSGYLT